MTQRKSGVSPLPAKFLGYHSLKPSMDRNKPSILTIMDSTKLDLSHVFGDFRNLSILSTPCASLIEKASHQHEGSPRHSTESGSSSLARQFASSCSPPHLAVTQSTSSKEAMAYSGSGTFTLRVNRPRGRTGSGHAGLAFYPKALAK